VTLTDWRLAIHFGEARAARSVKMYVPQRSWNDCDVHAAPAVDPQRVLLTWFSVVDDIAAASPGHVTAKESV